MNFTKVGQNNCKLIPWIMKEINFLHQNVHLNFSNTRSILAGRRDFENCLAAEPVKKYSLIL